MTRTPHGRQIDRLLGEKEMSLLQLADRIGMDSSQLRKLKNQTTNPTRATLQRVADGLGVDVAELLRDPDGAAINRAANTLTQGATDQPAPDHPQRRATDRKRP